MGLNLKIKILLVSLCLLISSTTLYCYYSLEQMNNNENPISTKITALEAINITMSYMDSKYETFNLSTIRDYSLTSLEKMPEWEITYIIQNDSYIIYNRMNVYFNKTYNSNTTKYTLAEVNSQYYPWDIRGFDIHLLRIDSQEAKDIINHKVENETWYSPNISFSLQLESSLSNPATPIWIGKFYSQLDGRYYVKINATTGEIINYYSRINSSDTYIDLSGIYSNFIGENFTAMDGLLISNYFIESKYLVFNLSRIHMSNNETGYCDSWTYSYIINDISNEIIHEIITVYANGTCKWYNRIYEMDELRTGEYHGLIDIQGFDVKLLKIDSDNVMHIISDLARNESWWNNRNYLTLELIPEDPVYYSSTFPIWKGTFASRYMYSVNATSGELVDYYASP